MIPMVVSAAAFIPFGIFHWVANTAWIAAALLVTVLLVVLTGMILVLVAAARATEPAGVFVLVRHNFHSS